MDEHDTDTRRRRTPARRSRRVAVTIPGLRACHATNPTTSDFGGGADAPMTRSYVKVMVVEAVIHRAAVDIGEDVP